MSWISRDIVTSLRFAVLSTAVCSIFYEAAVLGFAKVFVPGSSQGSLITDANGTVIGSRLLAQKFTQPKYFWPRPSAVDYNAGGTGGSNLSPTNPKITERARQIIRRLNVAEAARVPADLVTASGSGMDPHITPAAARVQVARVAQARGLAVEDVMALVEMSYSAIVAMRGNALINVLELNVALDDLQKRDTPGYER